MAIFSLANRTTSSTTATATQEIIAATSQSYRLLEFGFTAVSATTGMFGIGTPGSIGVTPTSPVTVLAEDSGDTTPGQTTTALAWGTGPTVPTNFFRRITTPATIGAGTIFTFPRGIKILKAKTLVLWITYSTTVALLDTWVVVDE